MQSVKDIKARIKSVSETAKITKAMELISASKMQKASVRYNNSQEYFRQVMELIGYIVQNTEEHEDKHPFLDDKRQGKKAYIVIGSDKGLAGDYNHNIESYVLKTIKDDDCIIYCIGEILYKSIYNCGKNVQKLPYCEGTLQDARIISTGIIEDYKKGIIREINILYTHLISKTHQTCKTMRLLPILKEDFEKSNDNNKQLEIEPDYKTAFLMIVPQYLLGVLYCCMTEAKYAEHLERMRAMSSATESAEELLEELQLNYNKARQEKITTELTELSVSLLKTE